MVTPRFGLPVLLLLATAVASAEDWKMGGRTRDRNPVSLEKNAPLDWQIPEKKKEARNIRWSAPVSNWSVGSPIVANGLVWVGSNNRHALDPGITDDRGVLACFRESDGKFLYQYTAARLERWTADWPLNGLSGSPVVEGNELWFITNRHEVVCLDTGPLSRGQGPPELLWKHDLIKEHGIDPHSPQLHWHNTLGSLAIYKDLLFVPTGNNTGNDDLDANKFRSPEAPSIVCLNKKTGVLVWKDHSASRVGFGGHCASPLVVEVAGKAQVIHPQADGWVRSFNAETGKQTWTFDTNPKHAVWKWGSQAANARRVVVATPVFADGRVYVAAGRDLEFGGGPGRLFCIDPTKTGDISAELSDGPGKGKPNPKSGLIWDFAKDGEKDEEQMHETLACVAIHRGLVVAPDQHGFVHCLDAKTGKRHWTYDAQSAPCSDPLVIDDKIYVADEEGDMVILELSDKLKVMAEINSNLATHASPVFANSTLYIQTRYMLFAIGTN